MPGKRKPRTDGGGGTAMARVILADPPWKFLTRSVKGKGRSAEAWYDCMTLADITALPVAQMTAPDSLLLLWTTRTYLEQAFSVIPAWDYVYKTIAFTWVKTTKDGKSFPMGMGYHTRGNPLAARGKGVQRLRRDVRELILSPRRKHSQKPDEAYERIEQLWPGPYLELFARNHRIGWKSLGEEVDSGPIMQRRWASNSYPQPSPNAGEDRRAVAQCRSPKAPRLEALSSQCPHNRKPMK
jgi:N6-adenosine-specific RNA methylase IME4